MNGYQEHPTTNGVTNGVSPKVRHTKRGLVDIIESETTVIWDKKVENTRMDDFRNFINNKHKCNLENYWDLHEWSTKNYGKFWEEIWQYFDVIHSKPYGEVVKNGKGFIDIDWFSGARLNYAENMLRYRDQRTALICVDEEDNEEMVTYEEMYEEVRSYAAAFRKNGLEMGDRVACYMSNRKEAIFAMLAATSIGAIWGGPLPFYGDKAASHIIRPMRPKFLFTVDRFKDSKMEKNMMANIPGIVKGLESLEKIVICPSKEETLSVDIAAIDERCCLLGDFIESGKNEDGSIPELTFEQLPFNYPIFINFTSGTTGQPKGLIHSAGSFLPLLRDFALHYDISPGDVVFTPYPVGWNLWNLFIANFALGATVLLYNGCPFFPEVNMWELMDKHKVVYTFFATSVVDKMEKDNIVPGPDCKLNHLRMVTVGASPVKIQNFNFLLEKVNKDMFVNCLYGATEVIGVFSGFDYNTPAYSAEIQAPVLGIEIKCFDEQGNSVIGQKGELVVTNPSPSFPIAMWDDHKRKKLQELYLTKYPGVWCQNDECWIDPKTKGIVIIGRSDDVLNPNGERVTSTEIYFAVHMMEELQDYICIGQDNSVGDQRLVLFIKLKEGNAYTKELVKKIQDHISSELTCEHVPEVVLEAKDIPYNLNNKKMEKILKKIIMTNEIPENATAKNPECLQYFLDIPELQDY